MLRYLPFLISLALTVYALVGCVQTPDEQVRNLPKLLWIILIVLVPLVGPITWLIAGRRSTPRGPGRPISRGPKGPDDDPDFLRKL